MIVQGPNLFMGNIGDSRAILGSKDSSDTMVATQLTVDLKPDLPSILNTFSHCSCSPLVYMRLSKYDATVFFVWV